MLLDDLKITKKIEETIKRYNLIKPQEKVILGVSGGADSVALAHILNHLKKPLEFKLYIAHLDHALRDVSKKEAIFVKDLAKRLNVPFVLKRVDIKKLPEKLSIEEKARNARFRFFLTLAKKINADKIATAHNFNDQAETVLMRLIRGTGLQGLSGIMPIREIDGISVIRPLLMIKREEIENFLKIKKIKFCVDKSNRSKLYFRNKIRHSLLPYLEKDYNKNIKEALFNFGLNAGSDYDYLKCSMQHLLKGNKTRLNLKSLYSLHSSALRFKIREAIRVLQGDTRRITFKHIQEVEDLIFTRPVESIVDLPKGLSVKKKKKNLLFYLR
jgi:tRNA(Ile)-lysidine synthase